MQQFKLFNKFVSAALCLLVFTANQTAHASITIDTTGAWSGATIAPFSNGLGTQTFGQVITTPQFETSLESFTFFFNDRNVTPYLGPVNFGGYVMAWDGTKATGPILFDSGLIVSTNNHGTGLTSGQDRAADYERFDFNTGGIRFSAGSQIVAFISTSNFYDGSLRQADVPWIPSGLHNESTPKAYPDGYAVWQNNGADFSSLTTQTWGAEPTADLMFTASFSVTAVPEPEPFMLLVAGLCLVSSIARHRNRRQIK